MSGKSKEDAEDALWKVFRRKWGNLLADEASGGKFMSPSR